MTSKNTPNRTTGVQFDDESEQVSGVAFPSSTMLPEASVTGPWKPLVQICDGPKAGTRKIVPTNIKIRITNVAKANAVPKYGLSGLRK
jgi:hypothetical protein